MKPISPARVRNYNTAIGNLLRDDRLSAASRLLAGLVGKYLDIGTDQATGKEVPMTEREKVDKELFYNILRTEYGSGNGVRWNGGDAPVDTGPESAAEKKGKTDITTMFEAIIPKRGV